MPRPIKLWVSMKYSTSHAVARGTAGSDCSRPSTSTRARIIVLDNFAVPSHKTQELEAILTKVGAEGKILLVDARDNRNLELASRNHPGWKTVDALAVNVYDVVDRPYLVVSEQALARLVEVLGA